MFRYDLDDHFTLRTLILEDAEEIFQRVEENRSHLRQWLPWVDVNTSVEDTRAFLHSAADQDQHNLGFHQMYKDNHRLLLNRHT